MPFDIVLGLAQQCAIVVAGVVVAVWVSSRKAWRGLLCGGAYGLAFFPPLPWPVASFLLRACLALVGLGKFARTQAFATSSRECFAQGLLFGMGFVATSLWGTFPAFQVVQQTQLFGLCLLVLGLLWGSVLGLLCWGLHRWQPFFERGSSPTTFVIGFAILWLLFDIARSWIPFPFPWNLTAHLFAFDNTSLAIVPLQAVRLFSVFLWSFLGSLWVASFTLSRPFFWRLSLASGLLILYSWNFISVRRPAEPLCQEIPVLVIQPNMPQAFKMDRRHADIVLASLIDQTNKAWEATPQKPVFIVWPETAVTHFFVKDLPDQLKAPHPWDSVPLVFGMDRLSPQDAPPTWHNSLFVVQQGCIVDLYNKERPLPFGEYLPCRNLIPKKWQSVIGGLDCSPGKNSGALQIPGVPNATVKICSEGMFSRRGQKDPWTLQVLNDAWFHRWLLWQHFAADRTRTVESGRLLLRVGNSGVTALLDSQGRILQQLPTGKAGANVFTLRIPPR